MKLLDRVLSFLTFGRTKAAGTLVPLDSRRGWWPVIRESVTGAWQRNVEVTVESVLTFSAVYACVTLISSDIAKMCLRLVKEDDDGIWSTTESAAFSPVLRKPNRYQTRVKFFEWWVTSKLLWGNTYALKQRDARGIVTALYILDPSRVTVLVAPDGSVYYELNRDDLSGLQQDTVTVPAREIIHDVMCALYHPLIGVSPIYACGLAALQGLKIQNNSYRFFGNGARPGGVLLVPGSIAQADADAITASWTEKFAGDNFGKVALLSDGMTYAATGSMSAVDSDLIKQLNWTAENVCTAFHVAPYMIGIGPPPPYANIEPLLQQYYSQCIQTLVEALELVLDEGLELPKPYGTEFDINDLLRMDTATRVKAAGDGIGSGAMSPNEARFKYMDLGPVPGGATPYMQNQMWPIKQLADRPTPAAPALPPTPSIEPAKANVAAKFGEALHRKMIEAGLYAAA